MRVAVIGCGTMGKMYIERLHAMDEVQLTAIYNRSPEPLAEYAAQYGVKGYTSYDELLASPEVDVVCVTLPTYMHKEVVLKAAAHGKHVICEKPLALNPQDAKEMAERHYLIWQGMLTLFVNHRSAYTVDEATIAIVNHIRSDTYLKTKKN